MKQLNKAFTLVELIVVVTILAILATIGFVSYSGYLTGVRDTNRVASLTAISDGLELYRTKNDLPLPDSSVEVQVESETIARQGYAGSNVLQTIEYSKAGKDPKDDQYYSYYLTDDKKHYQMMAFLEESDNLESRLNHSTKPHPQSLSFGVEGSNPKLFSSLTKGEMSEGQMGLLLGLETTFAATDYSNRHPKVYGKRLGILTDDNNTPIQEISTIKTAGNLNMTGGTTQKYNAIITDNLIFSGTGSSLIDLKNIQDTSGVQTSCKQILEKNKSLKTKDGIYIISTGLQVFSVYCDMTTDGGGWTMLSRATGESGTHFGYNEIVNWIPSNSNNCDLTQECISSSGNITGWEDLLLYTNGYKVKGTQCNDKNLSVVGYSQLPFLPKTHKDTWTNIGTGAHGKCDTTVELSQGKIIADIMTSSNTSYNGWPIRMGIKSTSNDDINEHSMLMFGATFAPQGLGTHRGSSGKKMDNFYGNITLNDWELASESEQTWFIR